MRQLKEFRIFWCSAFPGDEKFLDTILESKPNNEYEIKVLLDNKPYSVPVVAEDFIADLEKIHISKWHLNSYDHPDILDGFWWGLSIKYDDSEIITMGYNGFPQRFDEFLEILDKYGFPETGMKNHVNSKVMGQSVKHPFETHFSTYWDCIGR